MCLKHNIVEALIVALEEHGLILAVHLNRKRDARPLLEHAHQLALKGYEAHRKRIEAALARVQP